jgi:hypothetical protein
MTNGKAALNHYVSKFYLKNFSILGLERSVWCFDKVTRKKFKINVRNIGCEIGFYSQEIERYLAGMESKASPVLNKLIDSKDLRKLLWNEREILASFIVIQDNRTYELRETMKPVNKWLLEKMFASMSDEIKKTVSMEEIAKYVDIKAEEMAIETQRELLKKSIKLFSDMLLGLQWLLFENKTEMSLWTSDNPVNKFNPNETSPTMGNLGYLSSGVQIYFPLTPYLCLSLCDMGQYRLVPSEKMIMSSSENVIYQNHLVFEWSYRHIFSNDGNFELVERILKEPPLFKKMESISLTST